MGNNEDLEKGLRFHKEFTAMRQYIRENQIRDYDAFARYCREHKAGWAKLLEDPGRTDTVKGYLEFLQVRAGKDQAGGLTHVKKAGLEGEEEDADCGAEQTPVPPYAEMRKCIRENKIADLDEFAVYCRQHRPDWTERLRDSGTKDVLNGYIRFLKRRKQL